MDRMCALMMIGAALTCFRITGVTSFDYCPKPGNCSGCPLDWSQPGFTFEGTTSETGLCDAKISWTYDYNPITADNPSMNFVCIYGANGEYCESAKSVCASCGNVTFTGLDLTLNPYINYLDTCSNIYQFYIGGECGLITAPPNPTTLPVTAQPTSKLPVTGHSTNSPPGGNCPDYNQCYGCPGPYEPNFTQKGTLVGPNNCTVDITWNWTYTPAEQNMRMVFLCKYSSGFHCQPLDENVCATCEKFTISNITPNGSPYLEYSDTCGNMITYELTQDCF